MTPFQKQRLINKIKKIKGALAADKKQWGGYHHDGSGLRYLPLRYYIQLEDYSGGLRYLRWFNKNFPDDMMLADFAFEACIILFKTGRRKEAVRMAFIAFCRNAFVFDKFFGKELSSSPKDQHYKLDSVAFAEKYFHYSSSQEQLADFALWLEETIQTDKFRKHCERYEFISKQLETEPVGNMRSALVKEMFKLDEAFN